MRVSYCSLFLVGVLCSTLFAQIPQDPAQKRLMAKRAAQLDGYRNIAETIKGFKIDAQTSVRDFVAESDQIRTAFSHFIRGIRVVDTRYFEDGTCEVDVEVTIIQVVEELKVITKRYYYGSRWNEQTFNKITQYEKRKVIRATGSGVAMASVPEYEESYIPTSIDQPPIENTRPVMPSVPWQGQVMPQGRLLAQRAAMLDGYRNMAERIKGLKITSTTTVRDFVTENDQINTELNTFVKGIRPASEYRYNDDFTVEIDMEVTLVQVIAQLKQTAKRYYQGGKWHEKNFNQMSEYEKQNVIRVTGSGAVAERFIVQSSPTYTQPPISEPQVLQEPVVPEWANKMIVATGMGVPPDQIDDPGQARLMAERAAQVDAYRNLTEQIMGFRISSSSSVRDFIAAHDEIRTEVEDVIIAGARVIDRRFLSDGTAEVDVQINLVDLWNIVKRY